MTLKQIVGALGLTAAVTLAAVPLQAAQAQDMGMHRHMGERHRMMMHHDRMMMHHDRMWHRHMMHRHMMHRRMMHGM